MAISERTHMRLDAARKNQGLEPLTETRRVIGVPSLHTQRVLRWPDRSAQRKTGYPQKPEAAPRAE